MGNAAASLAPNVTMLFADPHFAAWLDQLEGIRNADDENVILPFPADALFSEVDARAKKIGHPFVMATLIGSTVRAFCIQYVSGSSVSTSTAEVHQSTTVADFAGLVSLGHATRFEVAMDNMEINSAVATEYAGALL